MSPLLDEYMFTHDTMYNVTSSFISTPVKLVVYNLQVDRSFPLFYQQCLIRGEEVFVPEFSEKDMPLSIVILTN